MLKVTETLKELATELKEHPEREEEIREKMEKTPEYQEFLALHYSSPTVQAASTYGAFKHKEETFSFAGMKDTLETQNEALRSGDLDCVENMLMAQAYTLDMLFHKLARRAIAQDLLNPYKIHLDLAFKAQRQCRANLQTLAEIKNPKPYIQNNKAQYQQVNNGTPASRAREKNTKSSNGLLENKQNETEWLDTRAPKTASGNDKDLETVEAKHRAED